MYFKMMINDFKEFLCLMLSKNDKKNIWFKLHGNKSLHEEDEYLSNEEECWDELEAQDIIKELEVSGRHLFNKTPRIHKTQVECTLRQNYLSPELQRFIENNRL